MSNQKMTAKQRQAQAAKQQKTEILVICIVAAAVILAVLLIALLAGGSGTDTTFTSGTNSSSINSSGTHQHDENCSHEDAATDPQPSRKNGGDGATLETAKATHYATIEIENYGTIKAELYGNTAPISVQNFVTLAESGFYEGLTFHRIIKGFMMQGGAPNSASPAVQSIEGEFASNGIENNLLHKRGVLSMARSSVMNSASSQFFIMHETSPRLDGDYAAFGMVIEGLDVVDAVCEAAQPTDGNGSIAADAQPVIKSITIEKAN